KTSPGSALAGGSHTLGVGGDRPGDQAAGGHRRRRADPGHGAALRPPCRAGVGARLCPALCDRWLARVPDGLADALWALGAAASALGPRASAQAALDAPTAVALCAGGQDRA